MVNKYDKVVRSDPRSPRFFQACDVARIAENCVQDTGTPEYVVLACIAKRLGYARIWVDSPSEALHSDDYSYEVAVKRFYEATKADIVEVSSQASLDVYFTSNVVNRVAERIAARLAASVEEGVAIAGAEWQDFQIGNIEAWLNWFMWRMTKLLGNFSNVFAATIASYLLEFVLWLGGMFEGLFKIVSVDVDDVLRENRDWCKCESPDNQRFVVDEQAAKEFDKTAKKSDKVKRKKKPINLPELGGLNG